MFSDHDFRKLFENAPVGLAVCNMEGKLLMANQAFADILGRSIEETLRLDYWNITPRKYEQQEALQLEELKKNGRYGPYEKHYIRKVSEHESQNVLVPVRLNGCKVQLDGSDCIWSAVERLEMPLHSVTLIKEAPVGLALCRLNGQLVAVNQAFADLIGRTIEETLRLDYWQITPRAFEKEEQKQLEQLAKEKKYGPYNKKYIHKNGELVDVFLIGKLLQISGEDYIWSVVQHGAYAGGVTPIPPLGPEDLGPITRLADDLLYTIDDRPIRPLPDDPQHDDESR